MKRSLSAIDEVRMVAKLADLKEEHYKHTLLLSALLELLVEKNVIEPHELEARVARLDLQGAMEASWGTRQSNL